MRKPIHTEPRAKRAQRDFLKKLFVWIFIIIFAISVAGGLIIFAIPH